MRMQPTTSYERGDIVLVGFIFPDQVGIKRRPALIISSSTYHQGRQETILAAITSNVRRILPGDTVLESWKESGLLTPSVVTGIIRTVKQDAVVRKLGSITQPDLHAVDASLRLSIAL